MQETTVEVNGVRLYTRRVGDGTPVVVLHGGPGAHHDYLLPQYDRLAHGRAPPYYDQRGGRRAPVPHEAPVGGRAQVADLRGPHADVALSRSTALGCSCGRLL